MQLRYIVLTLFLSLSLMRPAWADFVVNADGTVLDTKTCLQWQQKTLDTDGDGLADALTWEEALWEAEHSTYAGYTDWRLPNIHELRSLIKYSRFNPAIDTNAFPDTKLSAYWASTTIDSIRNWAWVIEFADGNDYGYSKAYSRNYARLVRGAQCTRFDLNISFQGNGHGTIHLDNPTSECSTNCSHTYDRGETVILHPVAGQGSSFSGWSGHPDCLDGQVTVNADRDCVASFTADELFITAIALGNGFIEPSGTQTVSYGSSLTFTITPLNGYYIKTVLVDGMPVGPVSQYTFTNITEAHTINAIFAEKELPATLSLEIFGTGNGTININPPNRNCSGVCQETYTDGANVTLTAIPDEHSTFEGWIIDNTCSSGEPSIVLGVYADQDVSAVFQAKTYTVTPVAGPHGTIIPSVPVEVPYGTTTSFTIKPDPGYAIGSVIGCGGSLIGSDYQTGPITGSCTVKATFIETTGGGGANKKSSLLPLYVPPMIGAGHHIH